MNLSECVPPQLTRIQFALRLYIKGSPVYLVFVQILNILGEFYKQKSSIFIGHTFFYWDLTQVCSVR